MLAILTEGHFIVTGTKSWRLKTGLGRHQIKYIKKCKYKAINWITTSNKKSKMFDLHKKKIVSNYYNIIKHSYDKYTYAE